MQRYSELQKFEKVVGIFEGAGGDFYARHGERLPRQSAFEWGQDQDQDQNNPHNENIFVKPFDNQT